MPETSLSVDSRPGVAIADPSVPPVLAPVPPRRRPPRRRPPRRRPPRRRPPWWRDLRDALTGADQDFTRGSLRRSVALLAIPMMLEMVLESVFAVVDVYFVGRLGAEAVAAVGLTEAMLTILFALAIGLSMAATALVARRVGEKDREGASLAAGQAILVGVLLAAMVAAVGIAFADDLLRWMGADAEVVRVGTSYTRILLGGNVTIVLLFLGNAILRGAGDAAVAMRVLWLANAINLVLDPCLIFGLGPFPELGLTGAAVATTIGRGCGVAFVLFQLARPRGRVEVGWRHLRLDVAVMTRLLRLSVGGIGQYLVETASWVLVIRILAVFGSAVLAGYTIAIRIVIFTFLPAWGMANASATLVGQNLGAGKRRRAEVSVWLTARYTVYFLGVVGIVMLLVPEPLVRLFTDEPEVVAMGVEALRWIASCYVPFAYGLVMIQALNGAGDTMTPTLLKLGTHWLWQLSVAFYLAHEVGLGPLGVLLAVASAELLAGVVGIVAFRRGGWKTKEV